MMKSIRNGLLKRSNKLIRILLSILGFSAVCSMGSCMYGAPEYGVPHASFIVKGAVKSEKDTSPIQNIQVIMQNDTTYTNEDGSFQVKTTDFPDDQSFLVEFRDVDGETNGDYQPLDTLVEFKDPIFTGDSQSWYHGETEKRLDVNLKDK